MTQTRSGRTGTTERCWTLDSDELESQLRPGLPVGGPPDIQGPGVMTESEEELTEIIDQDSDGDI